MNIVGIEEEERKKEKKERTLSGIYGFTSPTATLRLEANSPRCLGIRIDLTLQSCHAILHHVVKQDVSQKGNSFYVIRILLSLTN